MGRTIETVLVTGGSGYVGSYILRELEERGYRGRCLLRSEAPARSAGFEVVRGNILDRASLRRACEGCEAIVHLVGIIQEYRENTFERVHHQGAANVVTAAREEGVRKLIHMSALGTHEGARSLYHATKWKGEEEVRRGGIPFTIYRPSIIFGEESKFLALLAELIRKPLVTPVMGPGTVRFQPVFAGDVARCFVRALGDEGTDGRTIPLVGPREYSMNEVVTLLSQRLGRRKRLLHIPLPVGGAVAAVLEGLLERPPFTRDQLRNLEVDNVASPKEIRDILGHDPKDFGRWLLEEARLPAEVV